MSKIIIRGDVVININVASAEEAQEIQKGGLADLLKGAVKESGKAKIIKGVSDLPDDMPDDLKKAIGFLLNDEPCDCSGCKFARKIEGLGEFTDGEETYPTFLDALDTYGYINMGMEREAVMQIAESYLETIEKDGFMEVGVDKQLRRVELAEPPADPIH